MHAKVVLKNFISTLALVTTIVFGAARADAADTVISVLGDSLTSGYGLPSAAAFPERLEAALKASGRTVRVINAGVSGDTTAGGRARVDWMLQDKPDLVIVELGANDALRGLSPKEAETNLDDILTRIAKSGARILLTGMLAPPNFGREYGEEFKAIYPRLAQKHDVPLYPFFLDGVAADPKLNQPDGMHPNAQGVEVIVKHILPAVEKVLDRHAGG